MKNEDLYFLLVGREVELNDPVEDSVYNCAFVGMVDSVRPEHGIICVRDGEDNFWDVKIHEILSIF